VKKKPISVLVVDDSALMRNLISNIIKESEGLEVAGTAMNGRFALQKIPKLKPEIIVLDLEMPEMNGIEFLKARREQNIDIPVVILSSLARKGAKITMEALSLGASDFIMKPSGSVSSDIRTVGKNLTDAIRVYGLNYRKKHGIVFQDGPETVEVKPAAQPLEKASGPSKKTIPAKEAGTPEIIAIGISTGGPIALREVLSNIDADMPVPIVIVQHMPAGFTEEFAKSLDRISPLEISEAKDGDILKPGRVLIAPGNFHIEVEKKRLASIVKISTKDPVNGHRPSADVLFASVAKEYDNNVIAVIMTGMGRDGAKEIGTIRSVGGVTIAQNQATCVVYGMPKVAVESGHIQHVVPLKEIGPLLGRLVKN
jgi:two-component system, chemotaxis family, protein-glutamate methylesterase/glutaminase